MNANIIAITNQKGGVGKTTTTVNLSQALALQGLKILVVDLDPQGNATHGMGVPLESIKLSVSDLIREKDLLSEKVIYEGAGIDLIPSTPMLSRMEREMVGLTNSELRLARRLKELKAKYDVILIDTSPTFGPLMNSALNAAEHLILPVDSGFFAMMGIKELRAEMEEIQRGTNPSLKILGYLVTLFDQTKIAAETFDGLVAGFGDLVFETKIRRNVKLKEAPVFGKTIFHHAPQSTGAEDYLNLSEEVIQRLGIAIGDTAMPALTSIPCDESLLSVVGGAQ